MKKFSCKQCQSNKCNVSKDQLLKAGFSSSDKKVTTNFCSIECYVEYQRRLNRTKEGRPRRDYDSEDYYDNSIYEY